MMLLCIYDLSYKTPKIFLPLAVNKMICAIELQKIVSWGPRKKLKILKGGRGKAA